MCARPPRPCVVSSSGESEVIVADWSISPKSNPPLRAKNLPFSTSNVNRRLTARQQYNYEEKHLARVVEEQITHAGILRLLGSITASTSGPMKLSI